MNLILKRFSHLAGCTLGNLELEDDTYATMERPWVPSPECVGGTPQRSCVPTGVYQLKPHESPKFGHVFALVNHSLGIYEYPQEIHDGEIARSLILIHPANRAVELLGCIAPGISHGNIGPDPAVLDSRVAFARIRQRLGREETHLLTIREAA